MHDIRKPYIRSRSSNDLNSRVEQFESRSYYNRDRYEDEESAPVQIPVKRVRRNLDDMQMYPRRRSEDRDYEEEEEEYTSAPRNVENRNRRVTRNRDESGVGTWIFIVTVIVLAVGAGLFTYVFDSATVTVVPKWKDVEINKAVTFSGNELATGDKTGIPFIVTTNSFTKSKVLALSESKKIESKATGKVTIYNNFDESPQKLIKNTRLESTAGKIYRINQSVTVPGKKGNTPGSIEVVVFADREGTSYNASALDFTIPGFKGTPREKAFYAKSKGAISGGSSGNVSLASLSDMNAAKDELALELAQTVKADLLKVKKEGYIGLYDAVEITYSDNETAILNGTTGTYEVTATGHLIFADALKLSQLVATSIHDYANEPVRLGYTESMTYTRKDSDRVLANSSISILVSGKPRVIWITDFDGIKEMVRGKKRSEFQPLMKSLTTIQTAEISFSPLWLSMFPNDAKKIVVVESLPKR